MFRERAPYAFSSTLNFDETSERLRFGSSARFVTTSSTWDVIIIVVKLAWFLWSPEEQQLKLYVFDYVLPPTPAFPNTAACLWASQHSSDFTLPLMLAIRLLTQLATHGFAWTTSDDASVNQTLSRHEKNFAIYAWLFYDRLLCSLHQCQFAASRVTTTASNYLCILCDAFQPLRSYVCLGTSCDCTIQFVLLWTIAAKSDMKQCTDHQTHNNCD